MELEFTHQPNLARYQELNHEINALIDEINQNDAHYNDVYKIPRHISLVAMFFTAGIFFVPLTYTVIMLFQWFYTPSIKGLFTLTSMALIAGVLFLKVELMKVLCDLFEVSTLKNLASKKEPSWANTQRQKLKHFFSSGVQSSIQRKNNPLLKELNEKIKECMELMDNKNEQTYIHQCFQQSLPELGTQQAIDHAVMYRQFIVALRENNRLLALQTVCEYFKSENVFMFNHKQHYQHYI